MTQINESVYLKCMYIKDLYIEDFFLIENDTNTWKYIPCSWIGRIKTVKI